MPCNYPLPLSPQYRDVDKNTNLPDFSGRDLGAYFTSCCLRFQFPINLHLWLREKEEQRLKEIKNEKWDVKTNKIEILRIIKYYKQ